LELRLPREKAECVYLEVKVPREGVGYLHLEVGLPSDEERKGEEKS
jgi:hypothetical protein